jgi:hypothetical protein
MSVTEALEAICGTGKGHCWYCDLKLPEADEAVGRGWDVQLLEGERVPSVILVCPVCLRERATVGEDEFLRGVSLRVCNATC